MMAERLTLTEIALHFEQQKDVAFHHVTNQAECGRSASAHQARVEERVYREARDLVCDYLAQEIGAECKQLMDEPEKEAEKDG